MTIELDPEVVYEQWIGLLYACAVFRGVVTHPPPWLADTPEIGYVLRVDPLTSRARQATR